MNRFKQIWTIALIVLSFAGVTTSCSKEEETRLASEIKSIETFLKKNAVRYTVDNNVYKVMIDSIAGEQQIAVKGDSVFFYYAIFSFNGAIQMLYDTNDEEIADEYGIDKTFLKFKEKKIELGTTPMVLGLQTGIEGSQAGDEFSLLMPSTMGYGKHWNGSIPPFTPLYMWVSITNIK